MSTIYATAHDANALLPVHRHAEAYLTLVVEGAYTEFGPDGPMHCEPGTLLLHPPFHLHGDRFDRHRVRTLNLSLPGLAPTATLMVRRTEPRRARATLLRHPLAWRSLWEAADVANVRQPRTGWQALFVERLQESEDDAAQIAAAIGLTAEHASRALSRSHGVGPRALRAEWRFRRALAGLAGGAAIAHVAIDAGYADQAHFNRSCRAMTGLTPAVLRRSIKCVQSGGPEVA